MVWIEWTKDWVEGFLYSFWIWVTFVLSGKWIGITCGPWVTSAAERHEFMRRLELPSLMGTDTLNPSPQERIRSPLPERHLQQSAPQAPADPSLPLALQTEWQRKAHLHSTFIQFAKNYNNKEMETISFNIIISHLRMYYINSASKVFVPFSLNSFWFIDDKNLIKKTIQLWS